MPRFQPADFIHESKAMQRVWEDIKVYAKSDENILITGETGTGKELAAKAIHYFSKRNEKPFVALNCTAVPEPLFESELFGHKKGAFTGATYDKEGYIGKARQGTIFLDEIGNLPLLAQSKLLRFLQDKSHTVVGDPNERTADVRIISATNKDLEKLCQTKEFLSDLYYRLKTLEVNMPTLAKQVKGIPLIMTMLAEKHGFEIAVEIPVYLLARLVQSSARRKQAEDITDCQSAGKDIATRGLASMQANTFLQGFGWDNEDLVRKHFLSFAHFVKKSPDLLEEEDRPIAGILIENIRGLETIVRRMAAHAEARGRKRIEAEDYFFVLIRPTWEATNATEDVQCFRKYLKEEFPKSPLFEMFHVSLPDTSEASLILRALEENDWIVARTANVLGIDRKGLYRKMKKHGIARPGA